jgi:hypothetical protein
MSMYPQQFGIRERLVEHNVIRTNELPGAGDIDSQSKDIAAVDGVWIRIADLEGRYAGADTVKVFAIVGDLRGGGGEKRGCVCGGWEGEFGLLLGVAQARQG